MSATLPTLNLIGAGRVGQTLARLWTQSGVFAVQDVLTRSPASAQSACEFIGAGTPVPSLDAMRSADVWLIATTDAQITAAAAALAARMTPAQAGSAETLLIPSLQDATAETEAEGAADRSAGSAEADGRRQW